MSGRIDYSDPKNIITPRLSPSTVRWYLHKHPIVVSLKAASAKLSGKLLDVGCGNKPYQTLLNVSSYTGIDVESSVHHKNGFDVVFDGTQIPFEENSFDSVLCTEVLEHSSDPLALMHEMSRVLKAGGFAFVTAPMFIEHHEPPHDRQRFTYYGMELLASKAGLSVVWIQPRGGAAAVFVYALYFLIEQKISRRPFIDIVYWITYPFAYIALRGEKRKAAAMPKVSLGWQMLLQKQ